jgi:hypothetical protein
MELLEQSDVELFYPSENKNVNKFAMINLLSRIFYSSTGAFYGKKNNKSRYLFIN